MDRLCVVLAIPLIAANELLGIVLLGKKKSDEYYTNEDLNILTDLARTVSIAIKNSQVLGELTEEQKIAALGKVASGLSHNINNHLNRARTRIQNAVITDQVFDKLKADNISAEERKNLIDRLAEDINMVKNYIDAGAEVVRKARDFARPTKGPLKPVDMRTPLETAIFMVKEVKFKTGSREIPITLEIDKDVPKVRAKEDDLREVSMTLLDNAVDSIRMKELKGQAEETDGIKLKVTYLKNRRQVELRIIDTGIGIKEQDLEDIFLPFYTTKLSASLYEDWEQRRDALAKNGNEKSQNNNEKGVYGTGLGLVLVKSIVEELIKGTIKAKSENGKGATFIIMIPEWVEDKNGKAINS